MGNNQNSSLISKLERISQLYDKVMSITHKIKVFQPQDNYERKIIVPPFPGEYKDNSEREKLKNSINHTSKNAAEDAAKKFSKLFAPRKPNRPSKDKFYEHHDEKAEKTQKRVGCFSYVFLAICIVFILNIIGYRESSPEVINIMLNCAYVSGGLFVLFFLIKRFSKFKVGLANKEKKKNYDKKESDKIDTYEGKMDAYNKKMKVFEVVLSEFSEQYAKWRLIYLEHLKEEKEIAAKLEKDKIDGKERIRQQELIPAENSLNNTNDIVPEQYLSALDEIIELLQSARADSLKEAINLYEEILYREKELELQREIEQQRRYEEQQRRDNEERRYREEKRFREEQEDHRRREADQQLRIAEQQRRDEERRYREEQRASKGVMRCGHCAHYSDCKVRRTSGAYNCPGFTPR